MDSSVDAETLLGISDLKLKKVEVPQWGQTLTVRELDLETGLLMLQLAGPEVESQIEGLDDDQLDDLVIRRRVSAEEIAQVVAWGVINPDTGERVFSDEHVPRLRNKNRDAMSTLYKAIVGLTTGEAAKN